MRDLPHFTYQDWYRIYRGVERTYDVLKASGDFPEEYEYEGLLSKIGQARTDAHIEEMRQTKMTED